MEPDLRGRLAKAARLQTFATLPAKAWRTLSLVLTGSGVVLLSLGGWMFYEQYRDLIGPPPARIVEVSVEDLATDTPLAEPTQATPTQETAEVTFVSVTPTLPPTSTATPTSRAATPRQAAVTVTKTSPPATSELPATATPSPEPSPAPPSATPTNDTALSLAENPLPMVEEETATPPSPEPGGETQPPETVPQQAGAITRIVAETIDLDTPVIEVGWQSVVQNGVSLNVWTVADYAAGWHKNSMLPGQGGNVVLSGHHNIKGEVFRYIVDLEPGDVITLYEGDRPHSYVVEDKFIVKDKGEPEAIRRENAKWIGPFNEERLTLVTCWPYTNNTHRVIVIAKPAPQN